MGRETYLARLSFLEVDHELGVSAMRRIRARGGEGAAFSLRAAVGPGHEANTAASIAEAAAALGAEVVAIAPPTAFTPSAAHCDLLGALVRDLRAALPETELVWSPSGMWTPPRIASLADELELVVAVDPLAGDPLEEGGPLLARMLERGRGYMVARGLGSPRRRFAIEELEQLMALTAELDKAWVLFANLEKFRDAVRFQQLTGGGDQDSDQDED